ncbi:type I restriction endonuclease [Baaleninema sp.]|uniref:type I restriction endonuclease n=1 Tax=Baaleninema sp. TaxID=3101197 RepID=UPI003CFC4B3E
MVNEIELLEIAIYHIRKVSNFDPYSRYSNIRDRKDFQELIAADPAFGVLGLDDDRYITARVGGNLVTSLYRKIGDMYEGLFGYLVQQSFGLDENELNFSVEVQIDNEVQIRSTDGLIKKNKFNQRIPQDWMDYQGIGFEVRSCYQIGDSKRIQADYHMSLALQSHGILPVMLVFCNTSLRSPLSRLSKTWELYEGMDSFNLVELITGCDLHGFLQKNSDILQKEIKNILAKI